jgi:hypothetical protein
MHEPPEPPTGRTNRRLVGILAAVVLVGVFAGLLVWRLGGRTDTAQPNHPPAGVQPLAGHQFCSGSILIYTNTDADMRRIAQALGADPRAAGVFTRTKQESYTVYQRDFADQPSLLTLARPAPCRPRYRYYRRRTSTRCDSPTSCAPSSPPRRRSTGCHGWRSARRAANGRRPPRPGDQPLSAIEATSASRTACGPDRSATRLTPVTTQSARTSVPARSAGIRPLASTTSA